MKTLMISLDFLAGPLWKDEFIDGETCTGIPAIDNDEALQALNDQICELHSSYYEFDSHDQACWFNEEQEKADKPLMLELLGRLNARIAELNDGSFVVDDRETPRVEALQRAGFSNGAKGRSCRGALHEGDGFAAITTSSKSHWAYRGGIARAVLPPFAYL